MAREQTEALERLGWMLDRFDVPKSARTLVLSAARRAMAINAAETEELLSDGRKAAAHSVSIEDVDRWVEDARETVRKFNNEDTHAYVRNGMALAWHRQGDLPRAKANLDLYDAAVAERDRLRARLLHLREYGQALRDAIEADER